MRMNLFTKWNLDALGISASLACAVHCALLPLLITALPLLGLEILENDRLEYGLLAVSFVVGYTALFRGYSRHHRHIWPLVWFTLGFAGLLVGHFLAPEGFEPAIITTGALLIIVAHMLNLRGCKRCRVKREADAEMKDAA
ncbi:MerC domain-containing protein [Chitinophaga barathri]|uniref:MerC domain-containing protein n=1 Tax=Chitinophaga barathri TaxID=1647451 RepID=A0A3N4MJS7_9BACT|nr:MerC domain-containing protein [Chitinophaga barathri]RPD40350.1 MerC domain-containing protein [Chitinophaga barathri]